MVDIVSKRALTDFWNVNSEIKLQSVTVDRWYLDITLVPLANPLSDIGRIEKQGRRAYYFLSSLRGWRDEEGAGKWTGWWVMERRILSLYLFSLGIYKCASRMIASDRKWLTSPHRQRVPPTTLRTRGILVDRIEGFLYSCSLPRSWWFKTRVSTDGTEQRQW